jgi:hypothetical protein
MSQLCIYDKREIASGSLQVGCAAGQGVASLRGRFRRRFQRWSLSAAFGGQTPSLTQRLLSRSKPAPLIDRNGRTPAEAERQGLAGSGMSALGNRNVEADIRFRIASQHSRRFADATPLARHFFPWVESLPAVGARFKLVLLLVCAGVRHIVVETRKIPL